MVARIQEFVIFIARWFLPVCLTLGAALALAPVAGAGMDLPVAAVDLAKEDRHGGESVLPGHDGLKNWYREGWGAGQAFGQLGLDEKIVVHTDSKDVRDLIDLLAPPAWRVQYDAGIAHLNRNMVFHAETTRRRALDELCSSLGLKGIFYPRHRLILIVDKVRQ